MCGNYIKNTIVHDRFGEDGVKYDAKKASDEKIRKFLSEKIDERENKGFRLAKEFYKDCIDHNTLNNLDREPLMQQVKALGGWPLMEAAWDENSFEWETFIGEMYKLGYTRNYLINFFLSPHPTGLKWCNALHCLYFINFQMPLNTLLK